MTQREIEKSIKQINKLLHDMDREVVTGADEPEIVHSYRMKLVADANALLAKAEALRSQPARAAR